MLSLLTATQAAASNASSSCLPSHVRTQQRVQSLHLLTSYLEHRALTAVAVHAARESSSRGLLDKTIPCCEHAGSCE
jgi:hypothetical protein